MSSQNNFLLQFLLPRFVLTWSCAVRKQSSTYRWSTDCRSRGRTQECKIQTFLKPGSIWTWSQLNDSCVRCWGFLGLMSSLGIEFFENIGTKYYKIKLSYLKYEPSTILSKIETSRLQEFTVRVIHSQLPTV